MITKAISSLYYHKPFNDLANSMARKMVTMANKVNASTWREAAKEARKSRVIYEELQKTMHYNSNVGIAVRKASNENATLIKTLPLKNL